MTSPETSNLYSNVQNNNNIVWKNIEVYDLNTSDLPFYAIIANWGKEKMTATFKFEAVNTDGQAGFLNKGMLRITADDKLKEILKGMSFREEGIKDLGGGVFEIRKDGAMLRNITLEPNAFGSFKLEFIPANKQDMGKGFAVNFVQLENVNGKDQIVGGQTYVFGQVKGFGTAGAAGGATHLPWWVWILILILLLIIFILWIIFRKKK